MFQFGGEKPYQQKAAAIHQESLDDITTGQVPFQAPSVWIFFFLVSETETKMPQKSNLNFSWGFFVKAIMSFFGFHENSKKAC